MKYEKDFFECVDAKFNVLRLKRTGVISQSVLRAMNEGTDEEAKEIVYDHLTNHGTVTTLREWCDWAMAAHGYPRMQELGRKMKNDLA